VHFEKCTQQENIEQYPFWGELP